MGCSIFFQTIMTWGGAPIIPCVKKTPYLYWNPWKISTHGISPWFQAASGLEVLAPLRARDVAPLGRCPGGRSSRPMPMDGMKPAIFDTEIYGGEALKCWGSQRRTPLEIFRNMDILPIYIYILILILCFGHDLFFRGWGPIMCPA